MKNLKTFTRLSVLYLLAITIAVGLLIVLVNVHKSNAANKAQQIQVKANHLKIDSVNQAKEEWLFDYPTHL